MGKIRFDEDSMFQSKRSIAIACSFPYLLGTLVCADPIRTVALTGQHAPGTPSEVSYGKFDLGPVLNNVGTIAFYAELVGTGVTTGNRVGLWSDASGNRSLIARSGSQAPGTGHLGLNFTGFGNVSLNDAGQTAFSASLVGGGKGIWSDRNGSLELVARTDTQADGLSVGETYRDFGVPTLSNAGQLAYWARLNSTSMSGFYTPGLWSESSMGLAPLALADMQAADIGEGVSYSHFLSNTVVNDAGKSAFWAVITGSGIESTNNQGIWSEGSGNLALVAQTGNPAPGTNNGAKFAGFGAPQLNSIGQTAFRGDLTGDGINSTNDEGIWFGMHGDVALVARKGDHAHGTPDGVNFGNEILSHWSTFPVAPTLNSFGQIAFLAFLAGDGVDETNYLGIWGGSVGNPSLIARTGNHAPGTPNGVTFGDLRLPVLNDANQIAFMADLNGSSVDSMNDSGIWVAVGGIAKLVVRKGEHLEVLPGDVRTIEDLFFIGGEPGLSSGFNDFGELAFWARFTNGSEGIFTIKVTSVPEPDGQLLMLGGLVGYIRNGRSHRTRRN